MKLIALMLTAGTVLFTHQAVLAADGMALAKSNNCLLCHGVENKVMGPAYKDVATKYKGDASAKSKLVAKVKAGGSGVWGSIPMPPNSPQVSDADIETIVDWILKL